MSLAFDGPHYTMKSGEWMPLYGTDAGERSERSEAASRVMMQGSRKTERPEACMSSQVEEEQAEPWAGVECARCVGRC